MTVPIDAVEEMLRRLGEDAPAGMLGADDQARLLRLPEEKRLLATRRLALVAAWRGGERSAFADGAAAAALGSMSRSAFFALLAKGAGIRLDDLGLRLSGPGIVDGVPPRLVTARRIVADLLSDKPGASLGEVVLAVRSGGVEFSGAMISRILDDGRRGAPATGCIGADLRWDAAGLDLVADDGVRQRLYGLVDAGSGLLFGWSVSDDGAYAEGYRSAARMAMDRTRPPIGGATDGVQVVEGGAVSMTLPAGSVELALEALSTAAGWDRVSDPRRSGRAVVSAVGRGIGGVAIRAGAIRPGVSLRYGRSVGLSRVTDGKLSAIDDALRAHNEARLALALPISRGGPGPSGSLAAVISAVARPIATIRR